MIIIGIFWIIMVIKITIMVVIILQTIEVVEELIIIL